MLRFGMIGGAAVVSVFAASVDAGVTLAPGNAQMVAWVDFSTAGGSIVLDNTALDDLRAKSHRVAVIGSFGVHFSGTSSTLNAVAHTDHSTRLSGFPVSRREQSAPQLWIRRTSLTTADRSEIWLMSCEGCGGGPSWAKARDKGINGLADLQARLFHVMRSASSHLLICGSMNDMTVELLKMLVRRSSHITVKTAAEEGTGDLPEVGSQRLIAAKDDSVTWAVTKSELTDSEAQDRFLELAEEEEGIQGKLPSVTTHAIPPASHRQELYSDLSKVTLKQLDSPYTDAIERLRKTLMQAPNIGGAGTGAYAASLISVIVNQTNSNALDLPPLPRLEELLFSTLVQDTVETSLLVYNTMFNRTVAGDKDTILLISGDNTKLIEDRRKDHNGRLHRAAEKPAPAAQSEFTLVEGKLRTFVQRHWDIAFKGFTDQALAEEQEHARQGLHNKLNVALQDWKDMYVQKSRQYVKDVGSELRKEMQSDFSGLEYPCEPKERDRGVNAVKEKTTSRISEVRQWWKGAKEVTSTIDEEENAVKRLLRTEEDSYGKRASTRLTQTAEGALHAAETVFKKDCRTSGKPSFPSMLDQACKDAETKALNKFKEKVRQVVEGGITKGCVGDKEWLFAESEVSKVHNALRASLKETSVTVQNKNNGMITEECTSTATKLVEEFHTHGTSYVARCADPANAPTDDALDEFSTNRIKSAKESLKKQWGDWAGNAHDQCATRLSAELQTAFETVKSQCEQKLFGGTGVSRWKFDIADSAKKDLENCGSCAWHPRFVRSLLDGKMRAKLPPVPTTYHQRCIDRSIDQLMQKEPFRSASPYEKLGYIGIAVFTMVAAALVGWALAS